jgi:hypothetical protein
MFKGLVRSSKVRVSYFTDRVCVCVRARACVTVFQRACEQVFACVHARACAPSRCVRALVVVQLEVIRLDRLDTDSTLIRH